MTIKSNKRLLGIDLCRGFAAYAVVLVHSGDETLGLPISQEAIYLRMLFYFAVPFFLATSFYFLTAKPEIDTSKRFWSSRVDRIVIPYITWTLIYLLFRSFFFFQSKQISRLNDFLLDPLAISFFGGASYQLYFLPLLFTGTFLVVIAKHLQKTGLNRIFAGFLSIFSVIVYEWLLKSDNAFRLSPNTAFQNLIQTYSLDISSFPLLRILLVQIAWLLKCFPYLLIGILMLPLFNQIKKWNSFYRLITILSCGIIFLLSGAATFIGIPNILREILQAYSLLLLSLILSDYIPKSWFIESIGACSFGIYLIHPFFMLGVKLLLSKTFPTLSSEVSILSMLIISIATFLASWIAIASIAKYKWLSKYTLGV